MAKTVLLDELFVTIRAPAVRPGADERAVRRALGDRALLARLRRAVRDVIRAFPELTRVQVTVSR